MQVQQTFLGIDVSKNKLDLYLIIGEKQHCKTVKNSQDGFETIIKWCQSLGASQPHACMEATSDYMEACAEVLRSNGFLVSIVNPSQPKFFGRCRMVREKTDKTEFIRIR